MREALHQSATDQTTGLIDMDLITTGTSAEQRSRVASLAREIFKMLTASKQTMTFNQIIQLLRTNVRENVTEQEVNDALASVETDGTVFVTWENGRAAKAELLRK